VAAGAGAHLAGSSSGAGLSGLTSFPDDTAVRGDEALLRRQADAAAAAHAHALSRSPVLGPGAAPSFRRAVSAGVATPAFPPAAVAGGGDMPSLSLPGTSAPPAPAPPASDFQIGDDSDDGDAVPHPPSATSATASGGAPDGASPSSNLRRRYGRPA